MAIVKTIEKAESKIKSNEHLFAAIEYITRKEKASLISYNLCPESTPSELTRFFDETRELFGKNKGILAHHLVQSFDKYDNITPELAHKIGKELMEKCFPDFQVVVTTHIDGACIHNHFIINSVSMINGKKFYDNKKTINAIRRVSDELCYKNNLKVIEHKGRYSRIDESTYRLAREGKSWKFNLADDLDEALEKCNTKDKFVDFFTERNYEIKYSDNHIVFRKVGEKKSIRVDTLAKQFGDKYKKDNIDKKLGVESKVEKKKIEYKSPLPSLDSFNEQAKQNWKKYEKKYGKKIKVQNKKFFNRFVFTKNPLLFTIRLILYIFNHSKKNVHKQSVNQSKRYKIKTNVDYSKMQKTLSNVPYRTLTQTMGNVAQIKLYSWQLAQIFDAEILCHAKIDMQTGVALVTLKEHSLDRVANVLGLQNPDELIQQAETIRNRKIYRKLKTSEDKIEYLIVNKAQIDELSYRCVEFASFKKAEDKFNIAFSVKDKDKIMNILYPNKTEEPGTPTFVQKNAAINRRLKKQSEETGEKLCYKVVVLSEYKALKNTDIDFAVFRKDDGKFNVVFLEHSREDINTALKKAKSKGDVTATKGVANQNSKISP